jgi:DNA repair exonuclease SbcCD nuclease subunit
MIFLFYSDLHIRPERIEDCNTALEQVFEIAKKIYRRNGERPVIVNGGDTFNTRGLIRTSCFDLLFSHYSKWHKEGFRQWILVGNHDQEDREGTIHPMKVFDSWDGWSVIDKPQIMDSKFVMMPYMDKARVQEFVTSRDWTGYDCVVHLGIRGSMMNDCRVDTEGVPAEWFNQFRNVFSGHYHYRNSFQNIHYIGSPIQQNFSEAGQPKGAMIYEQESGKIYFHEILGTSKHYTIKVEVNEGEKKYECENGDIEQISKRDFVRCQVHGDAESVNAIGRDDFDFSANVKIERLAKEKHYSRLNIERGEVLKPDALMQKYVEFVETNLSKKKLIDIGRELL